MMTAVQYQVNQITTVFVGKTWKDLSKRDRYLLGVWLADETKKCRVGDELWLFNTTYCLKIKGWWDGEYCCPLPDAIILKTTKKKQREVLGGTRC